ncbi:MAG: hypothetical protein H7258_04515, partial [Ferruginibacter sp.]|nr:hypothetical protein [Ferruginibacter sp.]
MNNSTYSLMAIPVASLSNTQVITPTSVIKSTTGHQRRNYQAFKLRKAITYMLAAMLVLAGLVLSQNGFSQTTVTISSSGIFTVPAGVTSMQVYVYG